MPPREAKGRYFTREYMADADFMTSLDAGQREFYMMLSLFADDEGYLEWDPAYLMFSVYRYDDARADIWRSGVVALERTGRLRIYKCGHAFMPKVAKRPRPGGQETHVATLHRSRCQSTRVDLSRPKSKSQPNLTLPNLTPTSTIPNGKSQRPARAPARGGALRSLKEALADHGYDPGGSD